MKLKRVAALLLAAVMTVSLAACGGKSGDDGGKSEGKSKDNKLVIWTLTKDLEQFADKYQEETGVECETVIIEPGDYQTKVQAAILAGDAEPDIIVGEPDMLPSMMEAGLLEDQDQYGAQE